MDMSPQESANVEGILRELGRIVFNFSGAEHQLRRLAWVLIDEQDDRTGEITLDALGANGLENLVAALAPHRLGANDELSKRVLSTVKQFGELRVKRNNYVHSVWGIPNEASDLSGMGAIKRKFRQGTQVMVADNSAGPIALVASQIAVVIEELMALHDIVLARQRTEGGVGI